MKNRHEGTTVDGGVTLVAALVIGAALTSTRLVPLAMRRPSLHRTLASGKRTA